MGGTGLAIRTAVTPVDRSALTGIPDVLIADADQAAGRSLARQFARRGFRATHTARGEQVLDLAYGGRLRVVIVDVALDDMSGHVLVSRLKELDPSLRVLMTTSDHRPEFEVRAREIGILHYAQKPADYSRLEAIVTKAIGTARPV
jgi:DNA-binding NtrC family response regulator